MQKAYILSICFFVGNLGNMKRVGRTRGDRQVDLGVRSRSS